MNEEENGSKVFKKMGAVVKRMAKKVVKLAVIGLLIFILVAALFWGVIDGAFEKLSEVASGLKDVVTVEDKNIVIPEDFKEEIMKRLEAAGLDASELNLGGNIEYLTNWMEAEIVTSYPYMGGDGLQGVITVKRGSSDGSTISLSYVEKEEMENMIASGNASAKNYFTIDGDNMIVASTTIDPDGTVHISKNEFNYIVMVSPYSTPFEFFVALCLITQSPNFVNALADYTKNTTIEITLLESLTTTTTTTQITGTQTTSSYTTVDGVTVEGSNSQVTSEYAENPTTQVSYVTSLTPIITEARTLFIEKTVEPIYTDRTDTPNPTVYNKETSPSDCADRIGEWTIKSSTTDSETNQTTIDYEKIDITNILKTVNVSTRYQTWQAGTTITKDNTDAFLSFIVTDLGSLPGATTGTSEEQEIDLSQVTGFAKTILEKAATCKSYVATNGFTYGGTGSIPITSTGGTVDCSGFVSWVLYEAGYKATFGGHQWTSSTFADNPLGWEVVSSFDAIQPGDIIIMNDNKGNYAGHVQIYAGNGLYYNCGNLTDIRVNGATSSTRTKRDFNFALRPSEPSESEQSGTEATPTTNSTSVGTKVEGIYILYDVPGSSAPLSPRENLVTGAEMLFELLGSTERTQIYETVMRYILYRLTGHNYGVTTLDLNIFGTDSFTSSSIGGLAEYLRQFSHSGEAPQSSDGKYYLMYDDTIGWPTIGNADIQWKSHHSKFNVPGKVLENGQELEVESIETYVGTKLTRGHEAQYASGEIASFQIYIEKEVVDEVGENIREVYLSAVKSSTAGLNLSKQQLWALTAIQINFGHLPTRNGKSFKTVYQEGAALYEVNSWQHNRYIWDNWWCLLGGGSAGHIPARDAAFETYVKGVYDFSQSSAGEVFGRKYYIYYTASQIAQFSYAPNLSITRTSANEQEIFTYVERSGGEVGSTDISGYTFKTYTSSNGKTYTWYLQDYGPWVSQVSSNFGSTFAAAGCYCTSASIVASGYGDATLPSWSRNIYEFNLTSRMLHSACPGGVTTQLSDSQLTEIRNHLRNGGEVIVHVQGANRGGTSRYTSNQHWMPIVDISEDGTQIFNMNTTTSSNSNGKSGWLDIKDVFTSVNCYHLIHGKR